MSDENEKPTIHIPNPVLTFEDAFHNYREFCHFQLGFNLVFSFSLLIFPIHQMNARKILMYKCILIINSCSLLIG